MPLQLSDFLDKSLCHALATSLCHVERPFGEICHSVSLDGSPLNGVETSVTVKRCFDSVFCDLTTLIINFKRNAFSAQHDKRKGINYV